MGLRDTINKKKGLAVGVAAVLVVLAVGFNVWLSGGSLRGPVHYKVFFSDDDGKTYFADDSRNIPPFDHNGKQAYRAEVYRCGTGQPFVLYLYSWEPADQAKIKQELATTAAANPVPALEAQYADNRLVKKPGEAKWVKAMAREFGRVIRPVCPDGKTKEIGPVDPPAD